MHQPTTLALVAAIIGQEGCDRLAATLQPMLPATVGELDQVSRAQFAAALNMLLFADLLDRVPTAAAHGAEVRAEGRRICMDHGAIRTVALVEGDTGALPRGEQAVRRILEPLGYEDAATYPLPALRMTGRAYRHRDHPETIPQFFVSELHVEAFDEAFATVAARVFGASVDPLDGEAKGALAAYATGEALPFDHAVHVLPKIVAAFDRHHPPASLDDYDALKRGSKEAAWIATEGNAFNHATDRVDDVAALAGTLKEAGWPMKERLEISGNGRVRQTAFRADMVERSFATPSGAEHRMMVPGSFYEFISRDPDPETAGLDLSFDSGNATGIFHMTKGA